MSERPRVRGGDIPMLELFATGDWSEENMCLRTIIQLVNRKKLTELGEELCAEQAYEYNSKLVVTGASNVKVPEGSPGIIVRHSSLYCSVVGCHFSAEYIAVEMPGEVGLTFNFPTQAKLDEGEFPCKLIDQEGLEPK
jgi:hypothetical protein